MSGSSAEEVKVFFKVVLLLLLSEFAVFSELSRKAGGWLLLIRITSARVSITEVARIALVVASVVFVFVSIGGGGGVGVGVALALALIVVGAVRLWGCQSFLCHLRVLFLIMRVNGLGKGVELERECWIFQHR